MAATAVVNAAYTSGGPPPPYQSWSDGTSKSDLVSPPEFRRTSDNKHELSLQHNVPQIQKPSLPSLPSIHEALTGTARPPPTSYRSPVSSSFTIPPPPFSHPSSTPTRAYPPQERSYIPLAQRQSPPPPSRSAYTSLIPHSESQAFQEPSRRSSLTTGYSTTGPPNPYVSSSYEAERRIPETSISAYPYSQPPTAQSTYPYERPPTDSQQRQVQYSEAKEYSTAPGKFNTDYKLNSTSSPEFKQDLKRRLDNYQYDEALSVVSIP